MNEKSNPIIRFLEGTLSGIEATLNRTANFSTKYWYVVLPLVAVATVLAVFAIKNYFYFEADLTKFLPKDYATIKSDDYYRQNFNHQDFALVGIEVDPDVYESVWDPRVLRMMEKIILDLKAVTATKTFTSLITGQEETVTLPIGIDVDDIQSIANLEDIILDKETGALRTGRMNRSIKEDLGIPSPMGKEDLLPESDADLARLIPVLREHVMSDPLFNGVIISKDELAAMIQVPMQRKWDYMRRYIRNEISTALSEATLTRRFRGEFTDFPHDVWGQTLDGFLVDDAYVRDRVERTREAMHAFMKDYYAPVFHAHPELEQRLNRELTAENFLAIMQILEDKDLYQDPNMNVWETSTNDLYSFTLGILDPLARDNIEFRVYDPRQFVEVGYNADQIQRALDENLLEGTEGYITGYEYIIALLGKMMGADIMRLLRWAVLVDVIVLFVAFRSLRGMAIPMLTVVLSMIMALGTMFYNGVPLSLTTFIIPIVLLAVGTAYPIHIINRYHEAAARTGGSRLNILRHTFVYIGLAVFMAGVTTAAGLGSLAVTDLTLIAHFGIYSAVGVGYAIVLSFVLTPALLRIWPTPKQFHDHLNKVRNSSVPLKLLWSIILPLYIHLIWLWRPIERFHAAAGTAARFSAFGLAHAALAVVIYVVWFGSAVPVVPAVIITFLTFFVLMHFAWEGVWHGPGVTHQVVGADQIQSSGRLLDRAFNVFGWTVVKHYKMALVISGVLFAGAVYLAFGNYFESGIIYNFKKDNAIHKSDRFINRTLSGSYSIQLLFKFRDELALTMPEIVGELRSRVDDFSGAWGRFADTHPSLQFQPFQAVVANLGQLDDESRPNATLIRRQIDLVRDIIDEEYRISAPDGAAAQTVASVADGGELSDLDDLDAFDELLSDGADGGGESELLAGLDDIRKRMSIAGGRSASADRFIDAVRTRKGGRSGQAMQKAFNRLGDLFAMDIKQPIVLKKLLELENYAENIQEPIIDVDGYQMAPIGTVISPTDIVRKVYRVLYHGGDYAYDKLPEPVKDGLPDPVATERSVIGTVMNQAMSSDRDAFNRVIRTEMKEFQFTVLTRAGESRIIHPIMADFEGKAREIFPENDPYIERIVLSGRSPRSMEITRAIADSQGTSIGLGVLLVGLICVLLFRSLQGGLYAMIPLTFTIILNFAVINLLGFAITVMVMIVAAIAIGTGVDYTIHFLERYKIQIGKGDDPIQAYLNTLHTSGKAIFLNAVSVAAGFSVLILSDFKGNMQMGILMIGTMIFASMAALTTLPAIIFMFKPKFVSRGRSIEVL
ncbi:MAG: MMPL family transporter [SAR324 cluster bacterium]|nr:MMPL family transporter [SAR324 cluster bacterium]